MYNVVIITVEETLSQIISADIPLKMYNTCYIELSDIYLTEVLIPHWYCGCTRNEV